MVDEPILTLEEIFRTHALEYARVELLPYSFYGPWKLNHFFFKLGRDGEEVFKWTNYENHPPSLPNIEMSALDLSFDVISRIGDGRNFYEIFRDAALAAIMEKCLADRTFKVEVPSPKSFGVNWDEEAPVKIIVEGGPIPG